MSGLRPRDADLVHLVGLEPGELIARVLESLADVLRETGPERGVDPSTNAVRACRAAEKAHRAVAALSSVLRLELGCPEQVGGPN